MRETVLHIFTQRSFKRVFNAYVCGCVRVCGAGVHARKQETEISMQAHAAAAAAAAQTGLTGRTVIVRLYTLQGVRKRVWYSLC